MSTILFPDQQLITTSHFRVEQDWEIPIPGFFIVASLRKVKSIVEFTDEEAVEFIQLTRKIRQGMRDVLHIDEVYLFQNEDSAHWFHLRMFPRHPWMEEFGRRIQSVRPIMNFAKEYMISQEVFDEVKDCVAKMKIYLEDFSI